MENSKWPEFYEPGPENCMENYVWGRFYEGKIWDKFRRQILRVRKILSKILKIWRTGSKFRAIKDCRNHKAKSCNSMGEMFSCVYVCVCVYVWVFVRVCEWVSEWVCVLVNVCVRARASAYTCERAVYTDAET